MHTKVESLNVCVISSLFLVASLLRYKKTFGQQNIAAYMDIICGILTSVDSDEPVQPLVKLRNSKVCSVCSFTVI